ncbi:hypothetical protein RHSIM_Rhsim08G0146300 [Rhododendron simsii]|uniref:histone deacetylase n=1 Tax=Rhododendron simsii TaxID=118357 RepID=A0A834LDC3_RHOSS|nr:hypothetical protein RHSIM_Rhsim08G0146300 [Rhododendron simsii]
MEKMELKSEDNKGENRRRRRVGLIHDERMCKHFAPDDDYHPENPNRILAIWNKLKSSGITQRCVVLSAKEAEDKYIAAVHTKNHIDLIKSISSKKFDSRRERIAAKYNSIYFNEGSSEAAYLAAGSVLEVAEKVAKGELDSAFAIVRPPGHHAEENEPMGFCLHNNVAVATSFLLNKRELGIKKILIVDWDVHHGNGTQKMFWKDPRVLFFSVHRYDFGTFYPASEDGSHIMIGKGPGAGYNINVPWESGRCGDADYIAAWDHVLIPVAKEFSPDIIMISAGFDAAVGDPLGGCCVTPYGYSVMLKKLMEFAQGKIVMALEGGYNLDSIANSVLACVEVLVEEKPLSGSSEAYPFESTWRVIQAVREKLSPFWPILNYELSKKLTDGKAPPIQLNGDVNERNKKAEEPAQAAEQRAKEAKHQVRTTDKMREIVESPVAREIEGDRRGNCGDRKEVLLCRQGMGKLLIQSRLWSLKAITFKAFCSVLLSWMVVSSSPLALGKAYILVYYAEEFSLTLCCPGDMEGQQEGAGEETPFLFIVNCTWYIILEFGLQYSEERGLRERDCVARWCHSNDGNGDGCVISCLDSDGENDICANIISEDLEKAVQDVLQPFSELRVGINSNDEVSTVSAPWRLQLSKIDVWYATFGSNMCESRFLCYIQGGQVEGMRKACAGSLDKSPPKEILWKTVPHRLFFGRDQTKTWGPGGVAFLHPESNSQNRAFMCLYRITLEQFNDVLLQENVSRFDLSSPVFDLTDLDSIMEKGKSVEVVERGWYRNVVHLGNESGIPILTMTCTLSDVESFKSGIHPLCAPAKEYADTLVRGLVGGNQFSEEEAMAYILEASTNPL